MTAATIDLDFFRDKLVREDNAIISTPSLIFRGHKWEAIRKNTSIRFQEAPPLSNERSLINLIERSLIVLRLIPQKKEQRPCLIEEKEANHSHNVTHTYMPLSEISFDISSLLNGKFEETKKRIQERYPSLRHKGNSWILPCEKRALNLIDRRAAFNQEETVDYLAKCLERLYLREDAAHPSTNVDVSQLVTEETKQLLEGNPFHIQREGQHWLLSCREMTHPQALLPKFSKNEEGNFVLPKTLSHLLGSLSLDTNGIILSFLEPHEVGYILPYARNGVLAKHLQYQFTSLASDAIEEAMKGPIFSFSYHLEEIRKNVKGLNLVWRTLTPQLIDQLAAFLPNLQSLNVNDCKNIDAIIESLHNFSKLEDLTLSFSHVKGNTFQYLPTTLKTLRCEECGDLTDEALANLKNCTSLENLCISSTKITGLSFDSLPHSLKILNCNNCRNLAPHVIQKLEKLENLETLLLVGTTVQDEDLYRLHHP
jgi:hypothetical protein